MVVAHDGALPLDVRGKLRVEGQSPDVLLERTIFIVRDIVTNLLLWTSECVEPSKYYILQSNRAARYRIQTSIGIAHDHDLARISQEIQKFNGLYVLTGAYVRRVVHDVRCTFFWLPNEMARLSMTNHPLQQWREGAVKLSRSDTQTSVFSDGGKKYAAARAATTLMS